MTKQTSTQPKVKWTETIIPIPEKKPCKHHFQFVEGECKCRKCGLGLLGVIDIINGQPV